ncbi:hypothetical protein ACJX0J_011721, partial [Zea mays]
MRTLPLDISSDSIEGEDQIKNMFITSFITYIDDVAQMTLEDLKEYMTSPLILAAPKRELTHYLHQENYQVAHRAFGIYLNQKKKEEGNKVSWIQTNAFILNFICYSSVCYFKPLFFYATWYNIPILFIRGIHMEDANLQNSSMIVVDTFGFIFQVDIQYYEDLIISYNEFGNTTYLSRFLLKGLTCETIMNLVGLIERIVIDIVFISLILAQQPLMAPSFHVFWIQVLIKKLSGSILGFGFHSQMLSRKIVCCLFLLVYMHVLFGLSLEIMFFRRYNKKLLIRDILIVNSETHIMGWKTEQHIILVAISDYWLGIQTAPHVILVTVAKPLVRDIL